MLLAAGEQVQVAYIGLVGAVLVALITGFFGVRAATRARNTNEDTASKISTSAERVSAFESVYQELQMERKTREYFESLADRRLRRIIELQEQLAGGSE